MIAVMAIIGRIQIKRFHAPTATIEEVKASFGVIGTAVTGGVKDAEDQLDAAKAFKAEAKAAASTAHFVRDPIVLARQRRDARHTSE